MLGFRPPSPLPAKGRKSFSLKRPLILEAIWPNWTRPFPLWTVPPVSLPPRRSRWPEIRILSCLVFSEVVEVKGYVGNFTVTIKRQPTYVDDRRCTGCGDCVEACVLKKGVPSEFEEGMTSRRAIYVAFPQAVPLKAVVDKENCLLLSKGKCKKACVEACKAGATILIRERKWSRGSGVDCPRHGVRSL